MHICQRCHGERTIACPFCILTNRIYLPLTVGDSDCMLCHGSGEVCCPNCEGNGKFYKLTP